MTTSEMATVLAWHDALNEKDFDTLLSLSSVDIDVADADGARQGHDALLEWLKSTGITAVPGRMYVHDGVVVVEERISGPDTPGGGVPAATAFRVVNDDVVSVFRHDDLPSALAATGLTEADLVD